MPTTTDFTVTPYVVKGDIDYDRLLDDFGANRLTETQIAQFPKPIHPLVRRRIFYAERDLDPFLTAAQQSKPHSIVTGRGPSGPMHIGHIFPFYFAKYLQDQTGSLVYIPISDDEKYFVKDQSLAELSQHTRENIRDILAVGFDPDKTRIIIDTKDADTVYPIATALAKAVTQSTVDATYGEPPNIGLSFYPAVQATHLILPQLVEGRHPTLVPIAIDQDPHVRVCRDIAGKERYDINKPGALLSKFLPNLKGPGKMSSSHEVPSILLSDDRETVFEKIHTHAYSGGKSSIAEHRNEGGDPEIDVSYQLIYYFFEEDDDRIDRLAREYRSGDLLSGELKDVAAERIATFIENHKKRRSSLGAIENEVDAYLLSKEERKTARQRVGYPEDALI